MSVVNEITPLEENETETSMDYDHISDYCHTLDIVQLGTNFFI
jgi:hypothetical protein